MNDQLPKSPPPNLCLTPNATFLQESGAGVLHLRLPGGHQKDLFGLDHVPVSHFHLPDDKAVKVTIATYGQSGSALSRSADLQRSLESKLRQQLPMGGLTMFIKGWKRKVTPSGRLFCQLAVSARPIAGTDCSLWPTPSTRDHVQDGSAVQGRMFTPEMKTCDQRLRNFVMWPTPNATKTTKNSKDPQTMKKDGVQTTLADATWIGSLADGSRVQTGSKGSLNPQFPCWLMGFSTAALSSMQSAMQSFRKSRRNLSKPQCNKTTGE